MTRKNNGWERREDRAIRAWALRQAELTCDHNRSEDDQRRIRQEMDAIRRKCPRLKLPEAASFEAAQ